MTPPSEISDRAIGIAFRIESAATFDATPAMESFYDKVIARARELSAQQGREGSALEELTESDKEVALGQAVEFAEYVVGAAKGSMVERAQKFLSLPYSQQIANRLNQQGAVAGKLVLVPTEPSESMTVAGFEAALECEEGLIEDGRGVGCRAAAEIARATYIAMIEKALATQAGDGDG